jgi:hypothetical protein
MGFVKNADEIARIEHALSHPRFVNGEMLSVDFLSEPEFVASILPPPLEPADAPAVTAMVGRWQSNCVGDFHGGTCSASPRSWPRARCIGTAPSRAAGWSASACG